MDARAAGRAAAGKAWILVGASGSGKTTLAKDLPNRVPGVRRAVTCTTRAPRPGEVDGVDYRFVTEAEFDRLLATDALVEWTRYGSSRYGLPADQFDDLAHHDVVAVLDIAGVEHLRERLGGDRVRAVFLRSPEPEALARRMRERGSAEGEIAERLALVDGERELERHCDQVIDTTPAYETVLGELVRLVEAG